jgi:hypothetical protein
MIANIPALPSPAKVIRDAARAVKRVASLSMKKLSAETLNSPFAQIFLTSQKCPKTATFAFCTLIHP